MPDNDPIDLTVVDPENVMFWDRSGNPISVRRAIELRADDTYRYLARESAGDWEVITAWLGTDQGGGDIDDAEPLIFGTVARRSHGTHTKYWRDLEWLAATEDEALTNHVEMTTQVGRDEDRDGRESQPE